MTDHPTPSVNQLGELSEEALNGDVPHATPERPLSDAARRALLEAAERRAREATAPLAPEHGGPSGPEPTRFGDWEKKGVAVDF